MQTHSTDPPSGPLTMTTLLVQSGPGLRTRTGIASKTPKTASAARIHPSCFTLLPRRGGETRSPRPPGHSCPTSGVSTRCSPMLIPRPPRGREEVPVQLSRLLHAHEIVLKEARAMARQAAEAGDDGTNDLLVSDVIRPNELQVWFDKHFNEQGQLVDAIA